CGEFVSNSHESIERPCAVSWPRGVGITLQAALPIELGSRNECPNQSKERRTASGEMKYEPVYPDCAAIVCRSHLPDYTRIADRAAAETGGPLLRVPHKSGKHSENKHSRSRAP